MGGSEGESPRGLGFVSWLVGVSEECGPALWKQALVGRAGPLL